MDAKKKAYGELAFLGGIGLAILLGLGSSFMPVSLLPVVWAVLAICGLVVGFLNINDKEVVAFLVASIALITGPNALSNLNPVLLSMPMGTTIVLAFSGFISALVAFIAPAMFIVAIKAIYKLAKDD